MPRLKSFSILFLSSLVLKYIKMSSQQLESEESGKWTPRDVIINVVYIHNVDAKKVTNVSLSVSHMDQVVAEGPPLPVSDEGYVEVGLAAFLHLEEMNATVMNDILGHPVLITVYNRTTTAPGTSKGKKSATSLKTATSVKTTKSSKSGPAPPLFPLIGLSSLNLGPLVMDQTCLDEELLVEVERKVTGKDVVVWTNLPRLKVTVYAGKEPLVPPETNINVLGVTMESMFNLPEAIPEGCLLEAAFPVPSDGGVMETIIFTNGRTVSVKDCECRKRWLTLPQVQGRAAFSKETVTHNPCDVMNPLPLEIDMDACLNNDVRRVHWNLWRNSVLTESGSELFLDKIKKYRTWPVEITKAGKGEPGKNKKGADSKERFTAFLNLGSLMYPGAAMSTKQYFCQAGAQLIQQEYQQFMMEVKERQVITDEFEDKFYEHLCHTGAFQNIKVSLQEKVLELVIEKYSNAAQCHHNEMYTDIYVYLVGEMHRLVNECVTNWGDCRRTYKPDPEDLQLYAEEDVEEGNYDAAKRLLLERIHRYKRNADYWIDYAVFCYGRGELGKAVESVKEGLAWNHSQPWGLLLYAVLLTELGEYCEAEMLFQVLVDAHPDMVESWMTYYLFCLKTEQFDAADVALQSAARADFLRKTDSENSEENASCRRSDRPKDMDDAYDMLAEGQYGVTSYDKGRIAFPSEPLAWSTKLAPDNSLCIMTAIKLLRLNAFKFAEMALAQELVLRKEGRSVPYMYYLAVSHYLTGRYRDALEHLEEAAKETGKDVSMFTLMGHCYHKLHDFRNSVDCYELVFETADRADDIPLIYLRLGNYYLDSQKYECAKQVLMTACKHKPTPNKLLSLGIVCYRLSNYEEAEEILTEANLVDSQCPLVWGYLALVNFKLERREAFKRAHVQAVKNNLKDANLLKEIEAEKLLHGIHISSYLALSN